MIRKPHSPLNGVKRKATRVTPRGLFLTLLLCELVSSCTIQQNINITIMTKKKIVKGQTVSRHNYDYRVGLHRVKGESMAVPGESYTIKELLLKHSQGIMPQIGNPEPIFDDQEDMTTNPTLSPTFDFAEAHELKQQTKQTIKEKQQALEESKKSAESADKGEGSEATKTAKSETDADGAERNKKEGNGNAAVEPATSA